MPDCLPHTSEQRIFKASFSHRTLFRRVASMVGAQFDPRVYSELINDESEAQFKQKRVLDVIDVVGMSVKVKQMAVAADAKAMVHYLRALKSYSLHDASRLLRLAVDEFHNALRALPDDISERRRLIAATSQVRRHANVDIHASTQRSALSLRHPSF